MTNLQLEIPSFRPELLVAENSSPKPPEKIRSIMLLPHQLLREESLNSAKMPYPREIVSRKQLQGLKSLRRSLQFHSILLK